MKKIHVLIIGVLLPLFVGGYFVMQKYFDSNKISIVEKDDFSNKNQEIIEHDKLEISSEKILDEKIDYRNVKFFKLDRKNLLIQLSNKNTFLKYINGELINSINDKENVISFNNNSLLTELKGESEKILKVYSYDSSYKEFNSLWESEKLPKNVNATKINDFIFVDDFFEGYGSNIIGKKYSTSEVVKVLIDDGFTTLFKSNRLLIVQKSNGKLLINEVNNGTINQIELNKQFINYRVKDFFEFELGYILYSSSKDNTRKITALDFGGNIMWEKEKNLPYFNKDFDFIENKDDILLFTSINKVEIINKKNGELISKLNLFDTKNNNTSSKLRVLDFLKTDEKIFFLTGEYVQSKENIHDIKYENILVSEFDLLSYEPVLQKNINHSIKGGLLNKTGKTLKLLYY